MKIKLADDGGYLVVLSASEAAYLVDEIGELPARTLKLGRSRKLIQIYRGLELLLGLKGK